MTLGRDSRVRCRIPCEVVRGDRRTSATVVDLSKTGIGLETTLAIEEGDDVQICLFPQRRSGSIFLNAIAWNKRRRVNARGRGEVQLVGCMLSDPPPAFMRLLDTLGGDDSGSYRLARRQRTRSGAPESDRKERGTPGAGGPAVSELVSVGDSSEGEIGEDALLAHESLQVVQEAPVDPALPRPKFPLPPAKQDPEEPSSLFRVRVKQVSGPRSRRLELYAQSLQDLERRIAQDLGDEWEILEIKALEDSGL